MRRSSGGLLVAESKAVDEKRPEPERIRSFRGGAVFHARGIRLPARPGRARPKGSASRSRLTRKGAGVCQTTGWLPPPLGSEAKGAAKDKRTWWFRAREMSSEPPIRLGRPLARFGMGA